MTVRWPLSRKIVCLALLNLGLLAAAFVVFAASQFRVGPESLLMGPAHDHIAGIANAFRADLEATPAEGRDALIEQYHARYGADVLLIGPRGERIAGPEIPAPREVIEEIRRGRGRGPGPPERRPEGPPPRPQLPREMVFLVITHGPTTYWAGARIPVDDRPGVLLLRSDSIFNAKLFFDWRWWLGIPVTVIAVSMLCWLPFVRGLTRSIAEMDRVTQQVALGRFDVQVAKDRQDELGDLGEQINRMSARLESHLKHQKRFLGDVAHELCAPLARIQFALGILEQRAGDENRKDVDVLHAEIQEMSALVNELLSFSKAGLQAGAVSLGVVNVAAVVRRAAAREASGRLVEAAVEPDLAVMANEGLLLRAISNVVRNAVRYAGDCGPITVAAERSGEQVAIKVVDCGPGLPPGELEEVFAPFYRPESARTRETGGVGLGLAIVRTCVEACRGTVNCNNREPSGLEVTIRLPLAVL